RGAQFDFAALVPPPIPDEQNGANTPLIQYWFPKPKADDTNRWPELFGKANSRLRFPKSQQTHNQDDRRVTDFVSWQKAFAEARVPEDKTRGKAPKREEPSETERNAEEQIKAAQAILEELKIYGPALDELRVASQRSQVRYPVEYKLDEPFSILLPHLAKIKGLVQELKIQACAELATGQADRAFDDVRLMLWLADSVRDEGFLICQLVRIACQQIATQPIWEGLMEHKWSEAQLKEIQERMLRVNFAEAMSRSMSDERAGGIAFMQTAMKRNNLGELLAMIGTPEEPSGFEASVGDDAARKAIGWLTPHGWLYLEMLNHSLMMDDMIADGWDASAKVFHPQTLDANEKAFAKQLRGGFDAILHHQVLARLLLPALTKASGKFSRAQAAANQVALACALERYHKMQHAYPESLAALVPAYLADIPNEAVSTNAMRYRRNGDGYILYSAGWDGVDDGGALINTKAIETQKGDWVWRMDR
ncbi:MAG TPA: hypothetical protein VGF13_03710, partial [Verrucomicrobiae bacterium]